MGFAVRSFWDSPFEVLGIGVRSYWEYASAAINWLEDFIEPRQEKKINSNSGRSSVKLP
jgi:hypothetical protein